MKGKNIKYGWFFVMFCFVGIKTNFFALEALGNFSEFRSFLNVCKAF
jgi:hypothetical protein